jgi:ketosteroid isomerase-like protein
MSQENLETTKRGNDALNRGDWEGVADTMDAHVLLRPDPSWPEQPVYGREAVVAFIRGTQESGGADMRIEEIVDPGDRLLVHRRRIMRGDRSGIEGDVRYSEIATYREGRVILIELFLEREQALKAVGLEE